MYTIYKKQIFKRRLFEPWVFDEGFGTLVPDRPWIPLLAFTVNSVLSSCSPDKLLSYFELLLLVHFSMSRCEL